MMNPNPYKQFVSDLWVDGHIIQAGDVNKVDELLTPDSYRDYLVKKNAYNGQSTYFLAGVDPSVGMGRAADADVLVKPHIYFDFDIKDAHPDITLEDMRGLPAYFKECLGDMPWRYIVLTGGGLHVHFFFDKPLAMNDPRAYSARYRDMARAIEELVGEKCDIKCCNPGRIARLPGTYNTKEKTIAAWGEKQRVEIMESQDAWLPSEDFLEAGREVLAREEAVAKQKAAEIAEKFDTGLASTFRAINEIPIANLLCQLKGWETDGRNFWEPGNGKQKHKACYVPDGQNFLVHGDTDHLRGDCEGYSCFTLVRELEGNDNNAETFEWFKERYPKINEVSRKEFQDMLEIQKKEEAMEQAKENVHLGNIQEVYARLKNFDFSFLKTGLSYADDSKWLIRGAVTRIGAASSVGKSAFAYWLTHHLLKNGHKGVIVSTEVQAPLVLASLLKTKNKWDFWKIIRKELIPTDEDLELYKNLWIFDAGASQNKMELIKPLVAAVEPDFVVLDFLQGIIPTDSGGSNYEKLTNYAFEVQMMAQELNASVIDLSQVSNNDYRNAKGHTDMRSRLNAINFKGSGDLFSSADVCLMLDRKRDFKEGEEDEEDGLKPNDFGVRMAKHKYEKLKYTDLKVDFETGQFREVKPIGFIPTVDVAWEDI